MKIGLLYRHFHAGAVGRFTFARYLVFGSGGGSSENL
jgi:hypothetical protein